MVQGQRQKSALAHEDVKLIIADQPSAKHDPKRVPRGQPPEQQPHHLLPLRPHPLRSSPGTDQETDPGRAHQPPPSLPRLLWRTQPHPPPICNPSQARTTRHSTPPTPPKISPSLLPFFYSLLCCFV